MAKQSWDTELYEAQHSFVWKGGEALVKVLDPQPGERVLDLGCGTGQLTSALAVSGALPLGLDASPDMIGQARQNYPKLRFTLQDAASMNFDREFDAIFSNAALHWMLDSEAVAHNMARALRKDGRLAVEFGGKGNIQTIETAIRQTVGRFQTGAAVPNLYFFPALGAYAGLLEQYGFEVLSAMLFDRPTALAGEAGMEQWIRQFASHYLLPLPPKQQALALREVIESLRPILWDGTCWTADYRRLRIVARKL